MTVDESHVIDFGSIKSGKDLIQQVTDNPSRLVSIASNMSYLSGDMIHALIAMDGFTLSAAEHWTAWKGLLIEFACDGIGHVALLPVVIKRCCSVLAGEGTVGLRAAEILAILATLIPDCVSTQLLVGLETACPYWKSSSTAPSALQAYFKSLLFLAETVPVLQDKILEFLLCQVILPLDLAVRIRNNDDIVNENNKNEYENENMLKAEKAEDVFASEGEATPVADPQLEEKLACALSEMKAFLSRMSKAVDRFRDMCYSMIRMFDKSVLSANQPKKTVQVFFWACQLDPVVTDRFLGFLTASLFARDAQLGANGNIMSNNAIVARSLMTIAAIIACFCSQEIGITVEQSSCTLELLLQWLERKAEALQVYRENLFSGNSEFLNPIEVGVCASVWQALLMIMVYGDETLGGPLLERINALARSELVSPLTLVNQLIWNQFTHKFDGFEVLKEARAKCMSFLKSSRARRQRESLRQCSFVSENFDLYYPQ